MKNLLIIFTIDSFYTAGASGRGRINITNDLPSAW